MKLVITGTSGFIGSRLLRAANMVDDWHVTAFSSGSSEGSHIVYRDLSDFGLSPAAIALIEEADVLIHAGAFIPKSGAEANHTRKCNGNITFMEQLLGLPWKKLKKIIFLSSVDVYTNVNNRISEDTMTMPATLYGLSKLYGERLASLYAADRGIACQLLRIGHVYGPGEEKYVKVIPTTIQNILAGRDVERWGEGKELRSFIYIDDVVTAILNAVKLKEQPGVINVVSGNTISIRDLINKLVVMGGGGTNIKQRVFHGQPRDLVFDNSKLRRFLLAEETDFNTGLRAEFRHIKSFSTGSL